MTRAIAKINERELTRGAGKSWHSDYADSAYIFIGNLDFRLSEGDVLTIFSQYGEPTDINLVRNKETGKSQGFCFLAYEDQRSTILAVDNLNGMQLLGRTVRVDHVRDYEAPEVREMKRMQRKGKLHEILEGKESSGKDGNDNAPIRQALLKELKGEVRVVGKGEVLPVKDEQGGSSEGETDSLDEESKLKRSKKEKKPSSKKEKKKHKKKKKKHSRNNISQDSPYDKTKTPSEHQQDQQSDFSIDMKTADRKEGKRPCSSSGKYTSDDLRRGHDKYSTDRYKFERRNRTHDDEVQRRHDRAELDRQRRHH